MTKRKNGDIYLDKDGIVRKLVNETTHWSETDRHGVTRNKSWSINGSIPMARLAKRSEEEIKIFNEELIVKYKLKRKT
jgi:uncharacterized protein YbcV (DUF1398 family)